MDNGAVDLQWMRVLVELDRRGTLAAVAEATGYSKSAVSQQLAAVQRAVGVPLTERVGRRVRLTPAGRALLPAARRVLADVEVARGTLDRDVEPIGEVRVAGFATVLAGPALRALQELSAAHPGLAISLQEREPREVDALLADDDIDVGLVYDYSLVPRYLPDQRAVRLLGEQPMALVVPARRSDRPADGWAQILGSRQAGWITNSRGTDDDELLHRVTAAHGSIAEVAHRIDSLELVTELVAAGLGVALVVSDGPAHPGVVYVDLDGAAGSRRIYACTRPGRLDWRNNAAVITAVASAFDTGRRTSSRSR